MGDADIDLAVKAIKASRVINSGQVCNCAERVYVQRPIADEFMDKLAAAMSAARCGDPLADETGGLRAADQRGWVSQGGSAGARAPSRREPSV